jgi:hypothetical protein
VGRIKLGRLVSREGESFSSQFCELRATLATHCLTLPTLSGANYMRKNLITSDLNSRIRIPKNASSTPQPTRLESCRHRVHGIAHVADSLGILIVKGLGARTAPLSDWVHSLCSFIVWQSISCLGIQDMTNVLAAVGVITSNIATAPVTWCIRPLTLVTVFVRCLSRPSPVCGFTVLKLKAPVCVLCH